MAFNSRSLLRSRSRASPFHDSEFPSQEIAQLCAVALLVPLVFIAAGGPLLHYSIYHPDKAKTIWAVYDPVSRFFALTPLKRLWVDYLDCWGVTVVDMGNQMFHPFCVPRQSLSHFIRIPGEMSAHLTGFHEPGYSYPLRHVRILPITRMSLQPFLNLH